MPSVEAAREVAQVVPAFWLALGFIGIVAINAAALVIALRAASSFALTKAQQVFDEIERLKAMDRALSSALERVTERRVVLVEDLSRSIGGVHEKINALDKQTGERLKELETIVRIQLADRSGS